MTPPMNEDTKRLVEATKAQRAMLQFYEDRGPTAQSDGTGTLNTWRSLIARGWLRRSSGLGAVESEITEAGRQALAAFTTKGMDHG